MADAPSDAGYWSLGINTALGLASSGVFGGRVQNAVNPRPAISQPANAPPPPPVANQQSVNPPADASGGIMGHLSRNWGRYAFGISALVLAVVLVRRKG